MKESPDKNTYVSPGMPDLESSGKTFSLFEFWPIWLMYLPVAFQWLLLSIRHRSLTLPLLANPELHLSGMVGIPKSSLLEQAIGECEKSILPWFVIQVTNEAIEIQISLLLVRIEEYQFDFPLVCKPDIGCRGSGVKLVKNVEQLAAYIESYPCGTAIMLQKLSQFEPEAGVFFVKHPHQNQGEIISLALKYMPYVVGDGEHTLLELINLDQRAKQISHLYLERHQAQLNTVIKKGTPYRLVFSASHSSGAIFRDGRSFITPELTHQVNRMMQDLPEFYYGRMDIKFASIDKLIKGEGLEIIEINAASSESLHIWDKNTPLSEAIRSLLSQYRTLFALGHHNRKRGYKTPGVKALLAGLKRERNLKRFYPDTD